VARRTRAAGHGIVAERAMTEPVPSARELWWLPLVTGVLWLLFSLLVFRADYTTVNALSILLGVFALAAAAAELIHLPASHGWWRLAHVALAFAFAVIGFVAFAHPGNTVAALATVFAFYILCRGIFDIGTSLLVRGDLWWLQLLAGLAEVALAFWAAGDFGHKTILLVVWIGLGALIRGVMLVVSAFLLRSTPA
jgi:uncharacterized membrane protein HdeD (DUF308 family)